VIQGISLYSDAVYHNAEGESSGFRCWGGTRKGKMTPWEDGETGLPGEDVWILGLDRGLRQTLPARGGHRIRNGVYLAVTNETIM
jgi:hypothetical protein